MNSKVFKILLILSLNIFASGCSKSDDEVFSATPRYIYVSSGACYSGSGNTVFSNTTASNQVYRINLATGLKDFIIADYNSTPSQVGDTPVGIASMNDSEIYVLIDNATAGARRVDRIKKEFNGLRTLFTNNTTALSTTLRGLNLLSNGDLLINKNTAVELITSANARITKGANPFINAPASPCATSTTLISKTEILNNQFILFLHAAVGQNRFGFVKPEGYSLAGDCTVAQSAPNAGSFPVATAYDAENLKLIVAYAGAATATDINSIYIYDLVETDSSVTIAATNKIYDVSQYPSVYPYLLYGISEMVYDSIEKKLYIASAISTATTVVNYSIEKFSYDSSQIGVDNAKVLSRDDNKPFYSYGGDTKCISDMMISN